MLESARAALGLVGGTAPAEGTGPNGAPGGRRWITAWDVLRRNRNYLPVPVEYECPSPNLSPVKTPLRAYQLEAVACGNPSPCRFVSGLFDIGCGLGKTYVGGELVRRAGGVAVVVTQHRVSVDQWKAHLREEVGLRRIASGGEPFRSGDALPEAVVTTYSAIVRVAKSMDKEEGEHDTSCPTLLWYLHCLPFAVLLLDEVHVAAADHFHLACRLRASVVYGLTGSLVREDDLLTRLHSSLGSTVLFQYHRATPLRYDVWHIRVDDTYRAEAVESFPANGVGEEAAHALNPNKVALLHSLLEGELAQSRVLVFCDSKMGAKLLMESTLFEGRSTWLITGDTSNEERAQVLEQFAAHPTSCLVSTRVCDAAIDFPDGCVVVQYHSCSGSRQQETQRCGRGSRTDSTSTRVIHLVNEGTHEEQFVAYRIEYMQRIRSNVQVNHLHPADVVVDEGHRAPAAKVAASVAEGKKGKAKRYTKLRRRLISIAKRR